MTYPGEFWNKGANFYEQNRNKLGVTLDLSKPQGLEILRELIAVADVFSENFTPRVIKNFGLEYEDLKMIKPDLIMVSSTGYGFYGPWANYGATGPATEGAAGLAYQTGYLGGEPVMAEIPYTDYTSGEHTVFAVMAALMHRLRTGEGQFVDISQAQATSATIPEILMDYSANGRTGQRMGNQDTAMSPHGCYPCKGDDPVDHGGNLHRHAMGIFLLGLRAGRVVRRPSLRGLAKQVEEPGCPGRPNRAGHQLLGRP